MATRMKDVLARDAQSFEERLETSWSQLKLKHGPPVAPSSALSAAETAHNSGVFDGDRFNAGDIQDAKCRRVGPNPSIPAIPAPTLVPHKEYIGLHWWHGSDLGRL